MILVLALILSVSGSSATWVNLPLAFSKSAWYWTWKSSHSFRRDPFYYSNDVIDLYLWLQLGVLCQTFHFRGLDDSRSLCFGYVPVVGNKVEHFKWNSFETGQTVETTVQSEKKTMHGMFVTREILGIIDARDKRHLRFTIRQFVEAFVRFHIQRHAAGLAFEACFVPHLHWKRE